MSDPANLTRRRALLLAAAAPVALAGCASQPAPYGESGFHGLVFDPFWYWLDYHYYYYWNDNDLDGGDVDWREALEDYWNTLSDEEKQEAADNIRDWVDENRPGLENREEIIAALTDDVRDRARDAWADLSPAERTEWRSRLDAAREGGNLPGTLEGGARLGIAQQVAETRPSRRPQTPTRRPTSRDISRVSPPPAPRTRPPASRIPRTGHGGFGGGRGGIRRR